MQNVAHSIGGTGAFALYFILSVVLLGVFVAIYIRITPYRELQLIRAGNRAAALSLGGAMVGFSIALGKAVAQSTSIVDLLIWAGLALVAQLIAYFAATFFVSGLRKNIVDDHVASGIFLAALSLAIGMLNSSAMTL